MANTKQGEHVMRAKLRCSSVEQHGTPVTSETQNFHAVCKDGGYPNDGSDEDNSYARWSPSADFRIHVANPNLFGKIKRDDVFYVDFHRAVPAASEPCACSVQHGAAIENRT